MFNTCYNLTSVPLFNTHTVTNFAGFFGSCNSLMSIPSFDTTNMVGDISNLLFNVFLATSVPAFNTSAVVTWDNAFEMMVGLVKIPALDMSGGTSFASTFDTLWSLTTFLAHGATHGFSLSGASLSHAAIVTVLTNLGTAAGAQTIDVTGNWGSSALTPSDLLIATAKGWTVAH